MHLLIAQKAPNFEWDQKKNTALQQVQISKQASLPLGPYDPTDSMVLKIYIYYLVGKDNV